MQTYLLVMSLAALMHLPMRPQEIQIRASFRRELFPLEPSREALRMLRKMSSATLTAGIVRIRTPCISKLFRARQVFLIQSTRLVSTPC